MSEQRLIAGILAADPAAERSFYDAHVDRIYRLAYRMTGDDGLAQDFTQEAFLRAFGRLADFRGEAALSTWLYSIAVSVVLTGLRKVKRIRQREILPEEMPARAEAAPDHGLRRALGRAIDTLPDDLRLVFMMHDVEGYKHREIAEILDVPVGTSKSRLSHARARLRERLGDDRWVALEEDTG